MNSNFSYTYEQFYNDAIKLSNETNNKFNICCTEKIIKISYIKATFNLENEYILNINILYNDAYQLPVLYFLIYDNNGIPISFNDYMKKFPSDNNFIKFCEISNQNHPLQGNVYEYMHLCKFNQLLTELPDIGNILTFWLSITMQIFNIDITTYFNNK